MCQQQIYKEIQLAKLGKLMMFLKVIDNTLLFLTLLVPQW